MSEFRLVRGFEDVWRPPTALRRRPQPVLPVAGAEARARLVRVTRGAPEVVVKISGRTRDTGHLRAHLDYISRNGGLEVEDRDGTILSGRSEVRDVAEAWGAAAEADSRRRANSPFSVSIVLSMPSGVEPVDMRDAARDFAQATFADRFDYVFALHTDAAHPHVHLTVRALGDRGERLNPKKPDLARWREDFAQALRDRGQEAEATPRRSRGITRKSERSAVAHLSRRHRGGAAQLPWTVRSAYREAGRAAFQDDSALRPWEFKAQQRQARIRALYRAQAKLLQSSGSAEDRALGRQVEAFVRGMPLAESRRLALARELRQTNRMLGGDRSSNERDRSH